MTDLTLGINPHQSVQGMVHDYEKKMAAEDAACHDPDESPIVPFEDMEPSREGQDYVRKGRLNPVNGAEIPPTPKTRTVQKKQFGVISPAYLQGYDAIRWD